MKVLAAVVLVLSVGAVQAMTVDGREPRAATAQNTRVVTTVIEGREGEKLVTKAGIVSLSGVVEIDRRVDRENWKGSSVHLSYRYGELVRATFF